MCSLASLTSPAVSTPGIKLPKGLSFNPYQQSRNVASHSTHSKTEFLLQSSQHSSLDYEAREDESIGGHAFKKHYIGVYDQAQSHLYLVPARKLVARSKLRPIARDAHEESQDSKTKVTVTHRSDSGNESALTLVILVSFSSQPARSCIWHQEISKSNIESNDERHTSFTLETEQGRRSRCWTTNGRGISGCDRFHGRCCIFNAIPQ